jgi:TAT (twin-arginine translocation) pathway signal sequence
MKKAMNVDGRSVNRRSFLKTGVLAGGAATLTAGLAASGVQAFADDDRDRDRDHDRDDRLTRGDVAILRFLAAAELLESDLWIQYTELGGVDATETTYQDAFEYLDGDGPQYITSNTLDEVSHATFLNAYLESKGAEPVNLDRFRNLKGSTATGAQNIGRLTNLMHLNVDTSWYTRYRSTTNPDFGATFPQAITITNRPAIPRTDADFEGEDHIQAIANTAAFHFASIEQGGSSLYPALGQKATSLEVLRIIFGIGGDEVAHFLEWVDFAGNAVQGPPFDFNNQQTPVTDNGLTFPNFNDPPNPILQTNLIFPVPCEFISPKLPKCAVIRPLSDKFGGALAAVRALTGTNLFKGQSPEFFETLGVLAIEADSASRER